jgi:hypothetical protein
VAHSMPHQILSCTNATSSLQVGLTQGDSTGHGDLLAWHCQLYHNTEALCDLCISMRHDLFNQPTLS